MPGGIALDLSSKSGAAWGGPEDGRPKVALWRLPSIDNRETMERAFAMLMLHLDDLHAVEQFEWMQVEAPLDTFAHAGVRFKRGEDGSRQYDLEGSARKKADLAMGLIGLWAVAIGWGQKNGLEVLDANVQTVRRHFVGHGRPKDPKAVVMARCRQLGWRADDDNIADASALWCYEMSCRYPGWVLNGTLLGAAGRAA